MLTMATMSTLDVMGDGAKRTAWLIGQSQRASYEGVNLKLQDFKVVSDMIRFSHEKVQWNNDVCGILIRKLDTHELWMAASIIIKLLIGSSL